MTEWCARHYDAETLRQVFTPCSSLSLLVQKDRLEIAEAAHRQNYGAKPRTLLKVSLDMAVSDPVTAIDSHAALYAAVKHAMPHSQSQQILDQLMLIDSRLAPALTELMSGKGSETSSRAQVQDLLQAMDKASL